MSKCRLCSSTKFLVSMFGGKCVTNRNYLRKIIEKTVNVKIEMEDKISKYVCINCCILAYNFYKFMDVCHENEKTLKSLGVKNHCKKKKQYSSLEKIVLPSKTILFKTLSVWLESKKNVISNVQQFIQNKKKFIINPEVKREKYVQTDNFLVCEVSVQTDDDIFPGTGNKLLSCTDEEKCDHLIEQYVQTDYFSVHNISVQTDESDMQSNLEVECRGLREQYIQTEYVALHSVSAQTDDSSFHTTTKTEDEEKILGNVQKSEYVAADNLKQDHKYSYEKNILKLSNIEKNGLCLNKVQDKLEVDCSSFTFNLPFLEKNSNVLNVNVDCTSPNTYASLISPKLVNLPNKTQNVEICNICDKILYSKNSLKKHKKYHMQCFLCKIKFRSIENLKNHRENDCDILKHTSRNVVIPIVKAELVKEFVQKYSNTFIHYKLSCSKQV